MLSNYLLFFNVSLDCFDELRFDTNNSLVAWKLHDLGLMYIHFHAWIDIFTQCDWNVYCGTVFTLSIQKEYRCNIKYHLLGHLLRWSRIFPQVGLRDTLRFLWHIILPYRRGEGLRYIPSQSHVILWTHIKLICKKEILYNLYIINI